MTAQRSGSAMVMGRLEWAVLAAVALLFGSAFFFTKVAVETVPPVTTAALRTLIAAPLAWAILCAGGGRLPPLGREWLPLMALGLLAAAIPYVGVAWGQTRIASGLGGILFATIPMFTVVAAHFMTPDEKFTATRFLGAALGLAGVALVVGPAALTGLDGDVLGQAVTLWAALSYGLAGVYTRRLPHLSPGVLATGQFICAAAILAPLSLAVDRPWEIVPTVETYWSIAAIAVLNTAVPLMLTIWLIRRAGATNTSLLSFAVPIVAVGIGAWLLDEALSWRAYAGLGFILVGATAINGRLSRRGRHRNQL